MIKYIKNKIKNIFCKHEYHTLTNLSGDAQNIYNARSISECVICGQIRYNKYRDPECDKYNEMYN